MEEIFRLARQLGEKIIETEQAKNMADARFIFDNDEEAQKLLFDYNDYRNKMQEKMEKGEMDQEEFKRVSEEINEKIKELKAHPVVGQMVRTENEFNYFVNQVMNILKATIQGEEEGGCSGSCSSCSGCH